MPTYAPKIKGLGEIIDRLSSKGVPPLLVDVLVGLWENQRHTYRLFSRPQVGEQSLEVSSSGRVPQRSTDITYNITQILGPIGPPTAEVSNPLIDGTPLRFELSNSNENWTLRGIGMYADVSDQASTRERRSITFNRQGNVIVFGLRESIYLSLGFYSSTSPAVTPPVAGDEGKMFLRFTQGANVEEWKSNVVLLDATLLTAYANQQIHVNGMSATIQFSSV